MEVEWRRNQKKLDKKDIMDSFDETVNYVFNVSGSQLYDLNYLKKLTFDS